MCDDRSQVHDVLDSINAAWRSGNPFNMRDHLHPEMTMALPEFHGLVRGREAFVASFEEFCRNVRVIRYEESTPSIDVVGDCAVATYRFQMLYERPGYREDSTGRDLWVFHRQANRWVAVWRTMLDLKGERSPAGSSS
jgi:hypothetical protein